MRTILDEVDPDCVGPLFKQLFFINGSGDKALEKMVIMNGCYLLSADGTGYFSSNTVHCDHCSMKINSKTGKLHITIKCYVP